MIKIHDFKSWLEKNTNYSNAVVGDIVSRMKRADGILEYSGEETYYYFLSENSKYKDLTVSVRSQIKKSVKLYSEFEKEISQKMECEKEEKDETNCMH